MSAQKEPGYDGLGFYHDPADPRLVVPKSNPAFGWTLNLSHPAAPFVLAALAAIILTSAGVGILLGHPPATHFS